MQQVAFKEKFRMPLQAQKEWKSRVFDGLDDPVGSSGAGQQGATDGFHRLMMGTIHLHARAFDDAVEQAAGCNGDAVRKLYCRGLLSVFEDIVHLGWEVLIERASAGNVHGLHASANSERWNLVADGQPDQVELKTGPPFGDERKAVSLRFSVEGRVKIWAASREK